MARNDAIGVSDESLENITSDRIYFISCESTLRYQNWIGRGFATIMIRMLPWIHGKLVKWPRNRGIGDSDLVIKKTASGQSFLKSLWVYCRTPTTSNGGACPNPDRNSCLNIRKTGYGPKVGDFTSFQKWRDVEKTTSSRIYFIICESSLRY